MTNGFVKPLLRSLLFSYLATGILLFALSLGLYKFRFRPAQVGLAVHLIYAVTCFLGGFLAGKSLRQRRFFCCFLTGAAYFLVLFFMSAALDKGITANMNQILTVLGICAASGTIGGMAS